MISKRCNKIVAFKYYYKPYITQYTALTISTTKKVHPHTLCGMVDLWKNSDKLSCKWGGEHTNNNRTFVTVSREMLRNETKQNKKLAYKLLFILCKDLQ